MPLRRAGVLEPGFTGLDSISSCTERVLLMNTGKSITEQLDILRETFDAISDFIIVVSPDHKILRVNRAVRDFFGLTDEEIIGRPSYKVIHGLDAPIECCPIEKALISTIYEESEINDRSRHYSATASPMFEDGKITALVHTLKDITALKEQERLKGVVETAGAVCHNLTQPMQVISANINLLESNPDGYPEDVRGRLSVIRDNVQRMGKLIRQFQNISFAPTISYDGNNNILDIENASAAEVGKDRPNGSDRSE